MPKRPNKIAKTVSYSLRSGYRWVRASHLRLLVSGLLAVGLVASVSIFAASGVNADKIVTTPKAGQAISGDFPLTAQFKPKKNRTTFNVQIYIDDQLVDSRVSTSKKKVNGKKVFKYNFQYGTPANRALFDVNLLAPGPHTIQTVAMSGAAPGKGALIKKDQHTFTVSQTKSLAAYLESTLTVKSSETLLQTAVSGRTDTRVIRPSAQTSQATFGITAARAQEDQADLEQEHQDDASGGYTQDPALAQTADETANETEATAADVLNEDANIDPAELQQRIKDAKNTVLNAPLTNAAQATTAAAGTLNANQEFDLPGGQDLVSMFGDLVASESQPIQTAQAAGSNNVITAAGDIATSGGKQSSTAGIIGKIKPNAVLTLGDNAYNNGSAAEYKSLYGPSWGKFKSITDPSPGNHDGGLGGYKSYFGAKGKIPYSFNLGNWHLVALNSQGSISSQAKWLKADLAQNPGKCILAYWHYPLFSSGTTHGGTSRVAPAFGKVLHAARADVVLNGHEHNYERFAPQNPSGKKDTANGIRQFVVGTGGRDSYSFGGAKSNSEKRISGKFGVLRMDLSDNGYTWAFDTTSGQADSGSGTCHNRSGIPPVVPPPVPPTTPIPPVTLTQVPPMLGVTQLTKDHATVDAFKLGGGSQKNLGEVRLLRATVDGVVTDEVSPANFQTSPTVVGQSLKLGDIADGKTHVVQLSALSSEQLSAQAGELTRSTTLTIEPTVTVTPPPPPPPTPTTPPGVTPPPLRHREQGRITVVRVPGPTRVRARTPAQQKMARSVIRLPRAWPVRSPRSRASCPRPVRMP